MNALLENGPGTDANDSSLLEDSSEEPPLTQEQVLELEEKLKNVTELPVGNMDEDLIDDAVPIPEASMGVFDLGPDEQVNITSAGFATCVGLLLERPNPEGGKRAGFSHVNSENPDGCGLATLVEEVGLDGLQAFLSTQPDVSDQDATLAAVLQWLEDRQIPLAGRAKMKGPEGSGNVMATLSGSAGPTFSSTTDQEVDGRLEAREAEMANGNSAFEGDTKLLADENALKVDYREGKISYQAMIDGVIKLSNARKYPMAFHPDPSKGGCRDNRWSSQDRKGGPGGSGGTGLVS